MKLYCIDDVRKAVFIKGAKLHKFYRYKNTYWELEYPDGSKYSKIRKGTGQKFLFKYGAKLIIRFYYSGHMSYFTTKSFRLTDEG